MRRGSAGRMRRWDENNKFKKKWKHENDKMR
jgi:hypothetical protein